MWNAQSPYYLNTVINNTVFYTDKRFIEVLNEEKLELECTEVKYYFENFIIGELLGMYSGLYQPLNELLISNMADIHAEEAITKIDSNVYKKIKRLLLKEGLEDHVDYISSILKKGYYDRILSAFILTSEAHKQWISDYLGLCKLIVNQTELVSIDFNTHLKHPTTIKSPALLEFLTNNIAMNSNDVFEPPLFLEYYKNIEKRNVIYLKDLYRDICLYRLVYYFKEIGYIKCSIDNVTLTNKICKLLYSLLLDATVITQEEKKPRNGQDEPPVPTITAITRNWFLRFIKSYPKFKIALLTDTYNTDNRDNYPEYDIEVRVVTD